jgi:hypothetical protein
MKINKVSTENKRKTRKSGRVHTQLDPALKKSGGCGPGTPTGSPPVHISVVNLVHPYIVRDAVRRERINDERKIKSTGKT